MFFGMFRPVPCIFRFWYGHALEYVGVMMLIMTHAVHFPTIATPFFGNTSGIS